LAQGRIIGICKLKSNSKLFCQPTNGGGWLGHRWATQPTKKKVIEEIFEGIIEEIMKGFLAVQKKGIVAHPLLNLRQTLNLGKTTSDNDTFENNFTMSSWD